jgi:hypothetical protein
LLSFAPLCPHVACRCTSLFTLVAAPVCPCSLSLRHSLGGPSVPGRASPVVEFSWLPTPSGRLWTCLPTCPPSSSTGRMLGHAASPQCVVRTSTCSPDIFKHGEDNRSCSFLFAVLTPSTATSSMFADTLAPGSSSPVRTSRLRLPYLGMAARGSSSPVSGHVCPCFGALFCLRMFCSALPHLPVPRCSVLCIAQHITVAQPNIIVFPMKLDGPLNY